MQFLKRLFSDNPKQKSKPSNGHPYDVNSLPTGARLHFQDGMILFNKGEFDEAEIAFVEANEIAPWHKLVLFMLVMTLINEAKLEQSRQIIQELIDESPLDHFALVLHATLVHEEGRFDEALKLYNKALYRRFPSAVPYLNYVKLLIDIQQDYERAKRMLQTAKQVEPNNLEIYWQEARIAGIQNTPQMQLDACNVALQYDPDNANFLVARAEYYINHQALDLSELDFLRALKVEPDNFLARTNYPRLLIVKGEYQEALNKLLNLRKEYPTELVVLIHLSLVYIHLEKYDECVEVCDHIIQSYPENSDGYNNRGYAYYRLEKYDRSLNDLTKSIELNPQDLTNRVNRLNLYLGGLNDHERALEDANHILRFDQVQGLRFRSRVFIHMAEYKQAIDELTKAIIIDPRNHILLNNRAWYKAYIGEYENALTDAEKAIAINNQPPYQFGTRGQAKYLLGDLQGSLDDYNHAIELSQDDVAYKVAKAIALFKLNRITEAIELWQAMLTIDDDLQTAKVLQEKYRFAPPFYEAMQDLEALFLHRQDD